jgi:2-polyprenyl-3-methyl-5-hydroxy-6-metoxy-1,4-benzoquinol methylase
MVWDRSYSRLRDLKDHSSAGTLAQKMYTTKKQGWAAYQQVNQIQCFGGIMLTKLEISSCENVKAHYAERNLQELQMANMLTVAQYAPVYSAAKDFLATQNPVLDWSCGSGHFSLFLASQKVKVSSIGFNSPAYIKELLPPTINYVEGDFREPVALPFQNGEFQVVFSIGVLEHVRETGGSELASMKEIHRLLRPNGIFFVCHLPNRKSWIEFVVRRFYPHKFHHQFLYSRTDIESLAQQSGFKILTCKRYGIFPKNSFEKMPAFLGNSIFFLQTIYFFEAIFSRVFGFFCQNWLVVLQRQEN